MAGWPVLAQSPSEPTSISSLNQHQWGAVALFHGLPSDQVRAIAQDQEGVLWFGTDNGLARFDGRRTQKITAVGVPSSRVSCLQPDPDGSLWIGSESGLYRFQGDRCELLARSVGLTIRAIRLLKNGQVAVACEQGTLLQIRKRGNSEFEVISFSASTYPLLHRERDPDSLLPLTSLGEVDGKLVIGTGGRGVLLVSGTQLQPLTNQPRAYFVNAVGQDSAGAFWFGGESPARDSGLLEGPDFKQAQRLPLQTGPVTALAFGDTGETWVGTENQGVFHLRGRELIEHLTFENTAGGLRSNRINAVFLDREGVAWFGTDRGICRYDRFSPAVEAISSDPESNFIRVVLQATDGRIWCGTNRGLFVRSLDQTTWQPVDACRNRAIHALSQESPEVVLVGTSSGLFQLNARSLAVLPVEMVRDELIAVPGSESCRAIGRFRGKRYLAVYGRGVEVIEENRRSLVWPKPGEPDAFRKVTSLLVDGEQRLLIGTAESGAFEYDGTGVKPLTNAKSLLGKAIWEMMRDRQGTLWVATEKGLFAAEDAELVRVGAEIDVRSVIADPTGSGLWCATVGSGALYWKKKATGEMVFSLLDRERGLPSDSVFALHSARQSDGTQLIWVGTNRGLARYTPLDQSPVLRVVRALGAKTYTASEVLAGIKLEYPQNSLLIEVGASSSRTFPEQFQYEFVARDAAGRVIQTGQSSDGQLSLVNLTPGKYSLDVVAVGNDRVVSGPFPLAFEVMKAPFPLVTVSLGVLLLLSIGALWWGYRQNRQLAQTNNAVANANRQLAETRLQLVTETETERRRIARDLHDQTLADLRRLQLMTDKLPVPAQETGDEQVIPRMFRHEIESISMEIRRICEDLSPSVLSNVGLAAALEWALGTAAAQLPESSRFRYEFHCPEDLEDHLHLDANVQIQIYRIVQEGLNNICRHAQAKQVMLTVELTPDNHQLVIRLEDDGLGFDPESLNHQTGRGLANIRSRASLISAQVAWTQKEPGGTVVEFRMNQPHTT